ncbi:MAG: hypothetical protein GX631_07815 [Dehalococcoidales bacterium]|nr:hypothetical protein [Dehalococcoidales bacterium]
MMYKNPDEGKSPEQLRKEREQRIMDAVQLKIPDRVPVMCPMGYFPAKYTGIHFSAAYYDYDAWYAAVKKTLTDFQPDVIFPQGFTPGKAMEMLGPKNMRWPGYGVGEDMGHQSIELELLKADEIDAYMKDPSDFMFRVAMSRSSEAAEGLAAFPPLSSFGGGGPMGVQMLAMAMANPALAKTFRTLEQAGTEMMKYAEKQAAFNKMMYDLGYPEYIQGSGGLPPYDTISIGMRGMQGTMYDMYRQPDKLLELIDFVLDQTLSRPLPPPNEMGHMRLFMTITRGSDNFISVKQWEKFYWPTFKKLVLELINRGGTPCIFFEGNCDSRMEYLLDFPKGKVLARLDTTDIFKAKEILKDHICLEGNVPSTLLQAGTVDDVKEHVKKLIDVIGKDGGFIVSPRSSTDHVKPENLRAMIDFTKEYGGYR